MMSPVLSVDWVVWYRMPKLKRSLMLKLKKGLEKNLAYMLHKPRRQRGEFLPLVVLDIDQQWVADLIEVQTLSKQNKGYDTY